MLQEKIGITSWGSYSPLGSSLDAVWSNYLQVNSLLSYAETKQAMLGELPQQEEKELQDLSKSQKYYHQLDRSVLMSILAARQAFANTTWDGNTEIGVNIGSSRGATTLFENYHQAFLKEKHLRNHVLTSPSTTLGNISSWTAKDLGVQGMTFSHSLTCSTAFQSMLNGIAWLQSGMAERFIVGGTEAPLTPFTIAQMQALRIYTKAKDAYPCRAMQLEKTKNTMALGEGAAVFCIEKNPENPKAWISGIGYATEQIDHPTSISKEGKCIQKSMEMALRGRPSSDIDVIITHAPGTKRGDQAEYNAIQKVFGKNHPSITNNKWKIGHTLGASGGLSLEMGLLMILHQQFIPIPYLADSKFSSTSKPTSINSILINTLGFGGTAVSIIIEKVN